MSSAAPSSGSSSGLKRTYNSFIQRLGVSGGEPDTSTSTSTAADASNGSSTIAAAPTTADGTVAATSTALPAGATASTMTPDLELLTKKRRIGSPSSVASKYKSLNSDTSPRTPSKGVTNISNVVLRKWTPTGSDSPKNSGPPRYCPGDRDELLRRLGTFQELTDWTPKPDRVSEIEWAKKGWVCVSKERVRCTLCSKELVVKLNRKEVDGKEVPVLVASEIEGALVDKYVELMTTSHQEACLWRKRGSDDSLLRIPLTNPKTVLDGLRQRYDELCMRKSFLPYEFNLRNPPNLDLDTVISYLPADFFTNPPPVVDKGAAAAASTVPTASTPSAPPPPLNRAALALAVLGWQGLQNSRIGPVPNSASCHTCLRRLGLWMFKSKEVDLDTNTVLVPAPMDHLDPLREHRFFCPWKNGACQRNSAAKPVSGEDGGERPAWELLAQVLKNEAFLRERASRPKSSRLLPSSMAAQHARSKSAVTTASSSAMPATPTRPTTAVAGGDSDPDGLLPPVIVLGPDGGELSPEQEAAKDKDRWARLRKVKSLFNTKAGNKLKRMSMSSRPGTGHSTLHGGD